MNWIQLAEVRILPVFCEHGNKRFDPIKAGNFLSSSWISSNFSRKILRHEIR
jgi:hypothetical protein